MALITCMSDPSTSSSTQKTNQTDEGQSQGPSGHQEGGQGGREGQEGGQKGGQEGAQMRCRHSRAVEDLQQEVSDEEDSGCECSVEELERMDAWTKGRIQSRAEAEILTHLGRGAYIFICIHRCLIYTHSFYFVSFRKTLVAIKESFK